MFDRTFPILALKSKLFNIIFVSFRWAYCSDGMWEKKCVYYFWLYSGKFATWKKKKVYFVVLSNNEILCEQYTHHTKHHI